MNVNMYQGNCVNLLDQPLEHVRQWLDSFDTIISDCDGEYNVFSTML